VPSTGSVVFFAIKPSSGRRACTGGHWTAKEIERDARDAAMKPSSGRRARTGGHWTAKEIERDARDMPIWNAPESCDKCTIYARAELVI
jgi:hypothetical protein